MDRRLHLGLLHGFGFASALSEVGLPQSAIPVAAALLQRWRRDRTRSLLIASIFAVIALARQMAQRAVGHGAFPPTPSVAFRLSGSSGRNLCFEVVALVAVDPHQVHAPDGAPSFPSRPWSAGLLHERSCSDCQFVVRRVGVACRNLDDRRSGQCHRLFRGAAEGLRGSTRRGGSRCG